MRVCPTQCECNFNVSGSQAAPATALTLIKYIYYVDQVLWEPHHHDLVLHRPGNHHYYGRALAYDSEVHIICAKHVEATYHPVLHHPYHLDHHL